MKRLFMAGFLLIGSVTILAITQKNKNTRQEDCSRNICCTKKTKDCSKNAGPKTDYIFWEPVSRLMVVPQ